MSALSVCHTLEFLAGRIEGPVVEKSIYEFCKAINTLPNEYRTERNKIEALKILNFKKKEKLLGVLAELHHKISEDSNSKVYSEGAARVIFLKGSPERVLEHCVQESYPENSHDYVVDMSEKGFTLFCYAFKHVDHSLREDAELKEDIRKGQFIFLGFAIVQKIIKPENVRAMKSLSDAAMRVLLISE